MQQHYLYQVTSLIILSTAIIGIGVGIHQVVPFAFVQKHLDDKLIAEGILFISFVQGVAGVIAGAIYSITMRNGIAFSLAFTVVYSIILILIIILKYKEPQGESTQEIICLSLVQEV